MTALPLARNLPGEQGTKRKFEIEKRRTAMKNVKTMNKAEMKKANGGVKVLKANRTGAKSYCKVCGAELTPEGMCTGNKNAHQIGKP